VVFVLLDEDLFEEVRVGEPKCENPREKHTKDRRQGIRNVVRGNLVDGKARQVYRCGLGHHHGVRQERAAFASEEFHALPLIILLI